MKVYFVNPVNLTLLEDAFKSGILETKDLTKDFGKNLYQLLSHIKISFVVGEISIFEAYMLKKFCNGNYTDMETYMDDNKINAEKYPNTFRTMQSIFLLNKSIYNDSDVEINLGPMLFPMKCLEKKCIVTFQGLDILSITGDLHRRSDSFFNQVYTNEKNFPDRSKKDIISDLLIEKFIREFYIFMGNKINYMDILTDSVLDFTYLDHAKKSKNLVSMTHVNTIYGDIHFINTNSDLYKESMNRISENKKEICLNKDQNMESTEIFFTCNTSLYTFLELFLYLPIGSILESTDFKIVYSSDQYIIPQDMYKYQTRITSILEKLHNERLSNTDNKNLDNYNLIPLNIRIQYTIKFKMSDISNILITLKDKIENENLYGDQNSYLVKEILKVIQTMEEYAIAVYKSVI